MNDNLLQVHNGQPMADSREVAKNFGKEHGNVTRNIRALKLEIAELNFELCEYTGNTEGISRKYPYYMMDRDAFSLLVMGFTGAK